MRMVSCISIVFLLVVVACREERTVASSELPTQDNPDGVYKYIQDRHLDLVRMNYLLNVENEEIDYYINSKNLKDPRLHKNWFNKYRTEHSEVLANELLHSLAQSNKLISRASDRVASLQMVDPLDRVAIKNFTVRITELKYLRDSIMKRMKQEHYSNSLGVE